MVPVEVLARAQAHEGSTGARRTTCKAALSHGCAWRPRFLPTWLPGGLLECLPDMAAASPEPGESHRTFYDPVSGVTHHHFC